MLAIEAKDQSGPVAPHAEFWPHLPAYMLSHLPLNPRAALPPHLEGLADGLQSLAALVNAVRILEEAPSSASAAGAIVELEHRIADMLALFAGQMQAPRDKAAAEARVRMLRDGADAVVTLDELHGPEETELFLFCGRLRTWYGKGDTGSMSALAAVPSIDLMRAADAIDPAAVLAAARAAHEDDRLTLERPPLFLVSELIMCAGEANRHPKHFAYFLPEDEFFASPPPVRSGLRPLDKTVVFANLYVHRYATSSYPRLERFVKGLPLTSFNPDVITKLLVMWMRGHDLGHSVRYPETDLLKNRLYVSKYATMCLEEALADCFGFMTVTHYQSHVMTRGADAECAKFFIGEMLRYIGRGYGLFQDSDAALLELAFLHEFGAITIESGALVVKHERLLSGVLALAKQLHYVLLGNREQLLRAFVAKYLSIDGEAVKRVLPMVRAMTAASRDLPISTTYSTR